MKGTYTFARGSFRHRERSDDQFAGAEEDKIPRHQASLRTLLDLPDNLELDLWLRYVDRLNRGDIPSCLELSLVGQNLFDSRPPEFPTETLFNIAATEMQRGVYANLDWRYSKEEAPVLER